MFSIHPDTTPAQAGEVIMMEATETAGNLDVVDDSIFSAWRVFRDSLEPLLLFRLREKLLNISIGMAISQ